MSDPDDEEDLFAPEDEPDDPDEWRDVCDDPALGDECCQAGTAYRI